MSLIEKIKEDREAGTPGPWSFQTVTTSCGVCHKVGEWPARGAHKTSYACLYEDYPPTTLDRPSEIATNASRIARVPEMEAALLAAEEMAVNLSLCADYAAHAAKTDPRWEGVAEKMRARLAAYREATA